MVLTITETIRGQDQPSAATDRSSFSVAVPIEPGQQTISVSVNVAWELS